MSLHYGNKNITEIYKGNKRIKEVYKGSKLLFGGAKLSYVILTDDTVIEFDLDNTPLSNLSTSGNATTSITINGQSVVKNTIKEIYFGDSYKEVTSIGNNFIRFCSNLTSVDLSPLSNVTSIGIYFLADCRSLPSVDLSPLSNVTSIGIYFLSYCTSLPSVDLSPLSNLTSIGYSFLSYCTSLPSVDLSPLSNLTSIGDFFLYYCTNLTSVDLSGLTNLAIIGTYFLHSCAILTTLIMGAETPPTLGSGAFYYTSNLSLILVPCGSESAYKSATNWKAKASIIQGDC